MSQSSGGHDGNGGQDPVREHRKRRRNAGARTQARSRQGQQVDLQSLLIEPVSMVKSGKAYKMDPFEAMLRRQLELALKERSLAAMKIILDVAIEYDLLRKPVPAPGGGVLLVPMITEEGIAFVRSWEALPSSGDQKQ